MDDIRVTAEQVSGTKERLQELRELMGDDKAVYDKLYRGLDPSNALAFHAAKELTGINTYNKNFELDYWDKVTEIENDAFGLDRSTEQSRQYQADLWRVTVDKLAGEIRTSMPYEDWREVDITISQELHCSQRRQAAAKEAVKTPPTTTLADRIAAAKEQCARQNHDRPAPKHDKGMER